MEKAADRVFCFDDFELDATKRLLLKRGEAVPLNSKAFDLLLTLVERRGEVLSKNELLEKVWADQFVEENNLTVHVAALRKALGERAKENRFIVTVPGRGYKFVGALNGAGAIVFETQKIERITVEEEEFAETPSARPALPGGAKPKAFLRSWPAALVVSGLAAALVVGAYFLLGRRAAHSFAEAASFSLKRLTSNGDVSRAALSPDGRWIVYVSDAEDFGTLYRIPAEGGEPLRLTESPAEWPRVSPDGKSVACGYNDGGQKKLAVIPIEGGEPSRLFDVPATANFRLGLRWTPDGGAVAYRDWVDGIWVQPLDAGAPFRLEGLPHEKLYAFDWSPDGKSLAFTRGTQICDVVLISGER
jgi:DNA-binding winged helix-turn-helix (wHTH) protein